jgi:hypothetical protein
MPWKGLTLALLVGALSAGGVCAREITPDAPLPQACGYDRNGLLAMDFDTFDKDIAEGWKPLADRPGCELAAAELLAAYRVENRAHLGKDSVRYLRWHEGQLRAIAGDTPDAITLLKSAKAGEHLKLTLAYTDATIAFLKKDRHGLQAARNRLASLPKPKDFESEAVAAKAKLGVDVVWPPNLDIVDALVACFGKPYAQAYGQACRAPQPDAKS